MDVEEMPVEQLAAMPAPYNPREATDEDIDDLKRSLEHFGVVEALVLNRRTDRIVGGHQRVHAAQKLGLATLPITWVDLDETDERLLNLALNKIGGRFTTAGLAATMAWLEQQKADLRLSGFKPPEISAHLGRIVLDPQAEWQQQGMPSFAQRDLTAFRSMIVHFKDQAAVDAFAALVGREFTDKTKVMWFPHEERLVVKDQRYQDDAA
jgi:hypothetical protein